jgi:pimeloyl-ACP methyl ester carboxylesterase
MGHTNQSHHNLVAKSEIKNTHHIEMADTTVRREVGRFRETRRIKVMRHAVGMLSKVAPTMMARIAYKILTTPPRTAERDWQAELRTNARTTQLVFGEGQLAVYEWGEGPTVLMVHGWGARATHMGKMIEPLVAAGFRVVSFDAPGHGESTGRSTDPVRFAAAVAVVAQHAGHIHTVIAHSVGVALALYAQRDWGINASAYVLISSLNHCKWFTEAFSNYMGLQPGVMDHACQMMVDRYHGRLNWDNLSVVEMVRQISVPKLLLHDKEDGEIPFQHTLDLLRVATNASLYPTRGLGHHRLLGDAEVIRRVVKFAQETLTSKITD